MMIRFLCVVLAIGLFTYAVFRTAQTYWRKPTSTPASEQAQHLRPKLRWLTKTKALVSKELLPNNSQAVRSGQSLLLIQKTSSGDSCLFGVYRVSQIRGPLIQLEAVGRVPVSQLQIWADAMKKTIDWELKELGSEVADDMHIQRCQDWMKLSSVETVARQQVRGRKFFIGSSRYSEIRVYEKRQIRLEVDHFRRGWWVTPLKSVTQSELHLRNATTGLTEKLILQFSSANRVRAGRRESRKRSDPAKSFSLPGWE